MSFSVINTHAPLEIIGSETLTVSSTAKALTASKYSRTIGTAATSPTGAGLDSPVNSLDRQTARRAFVTVDTQPIRAYFDGTTPDGSNGHYFAAGDSFELTDQSQIVNFLAYRASSADATVVVTYFG